mmetsp:Transcript_89367/g.239473  ORF Transcript_89367/g.239473 Transcript_89367/m.239473 type:complete len:125 (+) Transcript_89367:337-711(+)
MGWLMCPLFVPYHNSNSVRITPAQKLCRHNIKPRASQIHQPSPAARPLLPPSRAGFPDTHGFTPGCRKFTIDSDAGQQKAAIDSIFKLFQIAAGDLILMARQVQTPGSQEPQAVARCISQYVRN